MPKKTKLTTKQLKYVKAKAEGKTGVQAAMIAYDTDNYGVANTISGENMKKPSVQEALAVAFRKAGITLDKPVQAIADGLEAAKMNEYTGEVTVDHSVRLKAAGMALNLMIPRNAEGGTVNVNFINVAKDHKDKYGL